MRVLVVDADPDLREVIADLLIDPGLTVVEARDADEALQALQGDAVDVLLCHLPILRSAGGRLCRRVHALRPPPRIVAMSAIGCRAASDEADANLAKPFTRSQLLAAVRRS